MNGNNPGSLTFRGPTTSEVDFVVTSTSRLLEVVAGSTSEVQVQDRVMTRHVGATFNKEFDLSVQSSVPGSFPPPIEYTSLCPEIATIDQTGKVSRVTGGAVNILAASSRLTKKVSLQMKQSVGTTVDVFARMATGTLHKLINDTMQALVSGLVASEGTWNTLSVANDNSSAYARNPSLFCHSVDLTGVPVWNSSSGALFNGALISPRHVLNANHVFDSGLVGNGTVLRFLGSDGVVYSRTITASQSAGNDVRIVLLDSDLPVVVRPAKLLPLSYQSYLPSITNGLLVLIMNQFRQVRIGKWGAVYDFGTKAVQVLDPSLISSDLVPWYMLQVAGDSGSPAFVLIDGEAVLLTTWTSISLGASLADQLAAINTSMTSLGGGYQVTTKDLSGYATY